MTVLLLNASFEPLRVISLRRALGLVFTGKAEPITNSEDTYVKSSGGEAFPVPLVVRLNYMVKVPYSSTVPLNRRTLALRDGHACQVKGCDKKGTTIDHVIPRSAGGKHTWTNVALMCAKHNHTKGSTPLEKLGWELKQKPYAPRGILLLDSRNPAWDTWIPERAFA